MQTRKAKNCTSLAPFRVNPEKEILLRDGAPIPLTPKTFQILLVLVRHSNEVVTKEDLMKTGGWRVAQVSLLRPGFNIATGSRGLAQPLCQRLGRLDRIPIHQTAIVFCNRYAVAGSPVAGSPDPR